MLAIGWFFGGFTWLQWCSVALLFFLGEPRIGKIVAKQFKRLGTRLTVACLLVNLLAGKSEEPVTAR